jgi:hypothetical protein
VEAREFDDLYAHASKLFGYYRAPRYSMAAPDSPLLMIAGLQVTTTEYWCLLYPNGLYKFRLGMNSTGDEKASGILRENLKVLI